MQLALINGCLLVTLGFSAAQQFTGGGGGSGSSSSGSCSATSSTFKRETARFLNCIQDKIEYEIHRYEYEEAREALAEQTRRVETAFRGSSCAKPSQISNPSRANLKSFLRSQGFPSVIYEDLVESVSDVLWTAVKNEPFTVCFLGFIRQKFLQYIGRQTKSSIPSSPADGLKKIPLFTNGNKRIDWERAELSVNQMLMAALQAHDCGSSGDSVLRKLNEKVYQDACSCRNSRYCTCVSTANSLCPAVNRAVNHILDNPEDVVSRGELESKVLQCFQDHNGGGELAAKGLKLQKVFKAIPRSELDKMGAILGALVNSFFNSDFCGASCPADRSQC